MIEDCDFHDITCPGSWVDAVREDEDFLNSMDKPSEGVTLFVPKSMRKDKE